MPDPNSFKDLVDNIRGNMGTVSDSASTSLAQNSFIGSPLAQASAEALEEYRKPTYVKPHEVGTVKGNVKNILASAEAGLARFAGEIQSSPESVLATDLSNIPEEYLQAYIRVKEADEKGIQSDEVEVARSLLNQRAVGEPTTAEDFRQLYGRKLVDTETFGQRIENALKYSEDAQRIQKDWDKSDIVDQTNRQELSADLAKVYSAAAPQIKQGAEALNKGDLWGGASDIAEGITNLLFGGAESVIDNPIAIAEYVAENVPQIAAGAAGKLGQAAVIASSTGYAGGIYTEAVQEYIKKNSRLPTEAELDEMLGSSVLAGVADYAGDILAAKGVTKAKKGGVVTAAKEIAKSGAVESVTEGFQTAQEQRANLEETDYGKVFEAAVIGGASGAAIRGTAEAFKPVANAATRKLEESAKKADEAAAIKAAKDEAVDTGDITNITEPLDRAEVLARRNTREDLTQEEKLSNVDEISKLVQQEEVKQADAINEMEQILGKPEQTKEDGKRLAELESVINDSLTATDRLREFQSGASTGVVNVTEDIIKAKEGDAQAATRVFGSYRIDPNVLSEEDAVELSKATVFTPAQQKELKNHADLQRLIKSADEVNQNIVIGNRGKIKKGDKLFLGIANYRDLIGTAMSKGDTGKANKYLGLFNNFVEHQQSKSFYLTEAVKAIQNREVVPDSVKKALSNYGITKFTPATIGLANKVAKEVELLVNAQKLFSERIQIKPTQGSDAVVGTNNEVISPESNRTSETVVQDTPVSQPSGGDVTQQSVAEVQSRPTDQTEQQSSTPETGDGQYSSKDRTVAKAVVELKSTVSDRVQKTEGFKVNLGYEGLTDIEVYKQENGKWRIRNLSGEVSTEGVYPHYPNTFNTSQEALKVLNFNSKDELNALALKIDPRRVKRKSFEAVNLSFNALRSAIDIQSASRQVLDLLVDVKNNKLSMQQAEAKIKALKDQSAIDKDTYNTIKKELDSSDITPKKVTGATQQVATSKSAESVRQEPTSELVTEVEQQSYVGIQQTDISITEALLAQPNNPDAPLNQQNLVVANFARGNNVSALDKVSNFIGSVKANPNILTQYVEEAFLDNAKESLNNFLKFYDKVSPTLNSMFKPKKEEFKYQDYVQFLAIDGKLPDNVKAAIAIGAYDWFVNNARQTVINTDDDIRSMLGMDEGATVPTQLRELLGSGVPQSTIVQGMGEAAAKALNIRAKKTAGMNQQEQFQNSLGMYAFALLREMEWVTKPVVLDSKALDTIVGEGNHDIDGQIRLIGFNNDGKKLVPELADTVDGSRAYPSLMSDLFSVENVRPEPSFKPEKVSSKIKKSFMRVPQRTQDILNKVNKWKWEFNSTYDVFAALSRNGQREIMGYDFAPEQSLKTLEKGIVAKNESIDREINAIENFANNGYGKPFYLSWEVWKNQRMGIKNVVNPQSSKLHRFLIGLQRYSVIVDPKDPDSYNKYLVTVAGGFGITAEKKSESQVLKEFAELMQTNEALRVGIEAIRELRKYADSIDFERQQELERQILDAVNAGGEKAHTLQALETLASEADAEGGKFTHKMFREVDGITNGVNITSIQFADADEDLFVTKMSGQGIYFDDTQGFSQWRRDKQNKDSYERIAANWKSAVEATGVTNTPLYLVMSSFVGEIERNTAKSPLMTTIYGAGIKGVIANASNDALQAMYTKVSEALKNPNREEGSIQLTQLAKDINKITGKKVKFDLLADNRFEANRNFELNKNELARFNATFESLYKTGLEAALNEEYSDLFEARNKFNAGINLAAVVFNKMYQRKVDELVAQLPDPNVKYISIEQHEAILSELSDSSPIIRSLMSGSDLRSGVNLMKTERVKTENKAFKVDTTFNLRNAKSGSQEGRMLTLLEPGVGAVPIAVQSLDASNIVRTMGYSQPFLNVHDAICIGDSDVAGSPQLLNYSHLKNMQQYSIPVEFARMYDRVMSKADPDILTEVMQDPSMNRFWKPFGDGVSIQSVGTELGQMAIEFNQRKNSRLEKVTSAGQYFNGLETVYHPKTPSEHVMAQAIQKDIDAVKRNATNAPKTVGQQASTLGSSQNQSIKDAYTFETGLEINKYSAQQVFDYLGNLGTKVDSPQHTTQLKEVLDNVVTKVLTPVDLYLNENVSEETKGMITGTDMYIVNQDVNLRGSGMLTRMSMSSQEVMVHELVHAVTQYGVDNNVTARRELKRIYDIATRTITPAMLAQSNDPRELEAAQETWNYLFNPQLVNGRSNHLHEFVAFGLTNEPMRQLLAGITTGPKKSEWWSGANLLEKISNFISKVLDFINGKLLTGTYGLTADKQLDLLVRQIVGIQGNNRGLLVNAIDKGMAPLSAVGNATKQYGAYAINKLVDTAIIKHSRYAIVRAGGELGKMAVNSRYANIVANIIANKTAKIQQSENAFIEEMVAMAVEAKGRTKNNAALHDVKRIGNSAIDRMRQQTRNAVAKHLLEQFDPTRELTNKQKSALSYAVIKTDFNELVKAYGMDTAVKLLSDRTALENEIRNTEKGLDNFTRLQSENLGYFMSTGYSRIDNALLNAHNIARKFGTADTAVAEDIAATEQKVEVLASLYAVKYMKEEHKSLASEIAQHELSRGESNGMTALVYTLDKVRKEAREKLFKDTPELMIKGHMADHVDPNVSIKIGTFADEQTLAKQGYVKGPELPRDKSDPTQTARFIYVNRYGGLQSYLAGAVYLQSDKRKGTDLSTLAMDPNIYNPVETTEATIATVNARATRKAKTQTEVGKLPSSMETKLIPVFNPKGEIIDYRYIMGDTAKDRLLNRDTSFEVVMGMMAADPKVKPEIAKQNKRVVEALYEQFQQDYQANSSQYVEISQGSSNNRYREIWQMLPYEMKQNISDVWGSPKLMIRREHVDLLFGYRKHSVTNKWRKDPAMRSIYEEAFINVAELFFGKKAVPRLRAAEDFIQELVRMGKDAIVIKSFVVTLGNTISNLFLLSIKGINPITAIKDYTLAYKGAQDYKRKSALIAKYNLELQDVKLGPARKQYLNNEIAKLTEDLATNPVGKLISQGVLQNIIEDVDIGTDTFTFKKGLIDKATDKFGSSAIGKNTPKWLKSAASNTLILQGSGLYNVLRDMAQLSDFGARYALYNHLVKKGTSEVDAIGEAMDTFIDYDLPSGVGMQYANDMGLVMFSKYLVRVQKIILQTFRENPAGVLAVIAMQNYFNFGSNIHESLIGVTNPFTRISTPLDMIAAMDETVTMNTVSNLM